LTAFDSFQILLDAFFVTLTVRAFDPSRLPDVFTDMSFQDAHHQAQAGLIQLWELSAG